MKNPHEHNKHGDFSFPIIPYQAITGNNNSRMMVISAIIIIPYQAITGNNNLARLALPGFELYHTKR